MFAEPETLFSKATDQVSANLDGDIAILNLQSKTYFGLTGVGAFIWDKLEVPTNFADLTQAVVDEFEVDPARCGDDLIKFLERLASLSLLEVHHSKA